ncbi:LysM domain-containing protein [Podospora aff. communis PSN243]|uniref:LysM domain-containing protein n=1 Tax=Podospora aff. communis PSN243 TaxID=3040156 RepID=A0AAV9FZ83_9PEZI|nr:LysM domain-containing protein [Podospora aff. communis PSN243]
MARHSFSWALTRVTVLAGIAATALAQATAPAPTHPNVAANCNRWHVVESGNTCDTLISLYSISSAQFYGWNPDVNNACTSNFWAGFAYCVGAAPAPTHPNIDERCNHWHVVQSSDDCGVVTALYSITLATFLELNPDVNNDCTTNFWGGYAYCVSISLLPSSTAPASPSSTIASTTVPPTSPPGPTHTGSPPNCNAWHVVVAGQDCDVVPAVYGITRAQFLEWNTAIDTLCTTNFWVGYSYCVGLGPMPSSFSGSSSMPASSVSSAPSSASSTWWNSTYSVMHPTVSWNISTPTVDNSTWPPTATQPGQPSYCNRWHLVDGRDSCDSIVFLYDSWMSFDDLIAWNPAIGPSCTGLNVNTYICVGITPQVQYTVVIPSEAPTLSFPPEFPWTTTPLDPPDTVPFTPTISPTHGPMPTNCLSYYQAREGQTCANLTADFGYGPISEAQLLSWNPVLANDCEAILEGHWYCVAAFDAPPELPSKTIPPSPVPTDTTEDCVAWYEADQGDTCQDLADLIGRFNETEFKLWNPAVGEDCDGIKSGTYYCIAVPSSPTTRTAPFPTTLIPPASSEPVASSASGSGPITSVSVTSSVVVSISASASVTSAPASSTSVESVATPLPTQPTMVSGCRRFYFVEVGDGCWDITNAAGIDANDFALWNSGAGPQCSTLWAVDMEV